MIDVENGVAYEQQGLEWVETNRRKDDKNREAKREDTELKEKGS